MNFESLLNSTITIRFFVSFLLIIFLITIKSKNKFSNPLLALFLILSIVDTSTIFYRTEIEIYPKIDILRMDIGGFFYAPLLYLFVLSTIYSNFKLNTRHLWHAIPFILITIVMLPRFYLANYDDSFTFYNTYTLSIEGRFSYAFFTLQWFGYIVATFILLNNYYKKLKENYSIIDKTNYKWLLQMNIINAVIFFLVVAKNLYRFGNHYGYITMLRLLVELGMLFFICWLILKAMYAPKIFRGIDSNLQLVSSMQNKRGDISENNREDSIVYKQALSLKNYMSGQEPYLNPDLTIKDVALALKMEVRDLSLLINRHLNRNFYEFVSDYRIEKAKEILKNTSSEKLTILEVLYQVGFNSKSSFNTSFKKNTGLTPTEYRKKMRQ